LQFTLPNKSIQSITPFAFKCLPLWGWGFTAKPGDQSIQNAIWSMKNGFFSKFDALHFTQIDSSRFFKLCKPNRRVSIIQHFVTLSTLKL
jgi:hypothetical protein